MRRRGRHRQHPALPQPHVVAERAHRLVDAGRLARDCDGRLVAEQLDEPRQRRPEAVQKTAVPRARAVAAVRPLEHDDPRPGPPGAELERRPEAGEAAADDRHIGVDRPLERRFGRIRRRLLPPPGLR